MKSLLIPAGLALAPCRRRCGATSRGVYRE